MATDSRTVARHLVQTSSDFSTWTTQARIRCTQCSEGAGQVVGSASLVAFIGLVREPGATGSPAAATPITGLTGKWVRVLIAEAGGSITVDTVAYNALWYGIIDYEQLKDDGGGSGVQLWGCSGLAAHLGRVTITDAWVEVTRVDTGATAVGSYRRTPTLNDPKGLGGASSTSYVVNGSPSGPVPAVTGTTLTAKRILELWLATHGKWYDPYTGTWIGAITWALSSGTLLDFSPPAVDFQGSTLLDLVNSLISPRRGLSWRLSVSGTTATINVRSVAVADITVTDGTNSYTLAAATDVATPTLTSLWHTGVMLTEDQSATYDRIDVIGAAPWTGISLSYDPNNSTEVYKSLIAAWTSTEETDWALGSGTPNDKVWRTFRLNPQWDGRIYGANTPGLANAYSLTDSDYKTAPLFYALTTSGAPIDLLEITPTLPCGAGFTTDKTGPRQLSMAFWKPAGSSTWYDLQSGVTKRSLTIDNPPPSVSIGDAWTSANGSSDNEQLQNKNNLASTGVLVVSVGIREFQPLRLSWTRDSGDWPRTSPRTLSVNLPNCELWQTLIGTVKSVTAGALGTHAATTVVRDDLPLMRSALAFLIAYYGTPARSLTWKENGVIEHAYGSGACSPATLITTATLGTGSTSIGAVVTRRSWDLTEQGFGTEYSTERIVPDIEAIR